MTSTSDLLRTPGLTEFLDPPVPEGESPYVPGAGPGREIRIVEPDPAWPGQASAVVERIRTVLGPVAVGVEHVGSTSVPGLPAKPILDIDLRVPDPDDEASYVPPLEAAGFELAVREPWWYGHRLLRGTDPAVNLHVYGPDSPESARQRLFRDWLRTHPDDRDRYAVAKRDAAAAALAAGEHVQQYNARKQAVLRDVYARLFADAGLA
ncbi:GrpB family protein [Amnibacterium soli]|uniref:GrpB family protein n=1 Tax=Amnibacterium soli TaxID=1282736 RepID=A0ABP8YS33_9MICO